MAIFLSEKSSIYDDEQPEREFALTIKADEMDAAGVGSVKFIEGEPEKRDDACDHPFRAPGDTCLNCGEWDTDVVAMRARLRELDQRLTETREEFRKFGVHLGHCNFGEHAGACKYGDKDCPALSDSWEWFGWRLQQLKRCDDCGAMMNPIGKGIFECWKCVWENTGKKVQNANARAEQAEAQLASNACPHVRTSTENTSYCALAEDSVRRLEAQLAEAKREQSRRSQWLPSSGPMTENEFRLLFSESVCESDFPLVDDDGEFTTEAIDRLTNIAEGTAERLFTERDAALQRAEAAETRMAKMRPALEQVETYLSGEESPLYSLWENGDICSWDDNPRDRWSDVIDDLRNANLATVNIGHGVEWQAVTVYRLVWLALSRDGGEEEGNERVNRNRN